MEEGALGLMLRALRLVGAAPYMSRSQPDRVSPARVVCGRVTNTLLSLSVIIGAIYNLGDSHDGIKLVYGVIFSSRTCIVFIILKATYNGPERVSRMARFLETLKQIDGKFTPKLKYEICIALFISMYLVVYNISYILVYYHKGNGLNDIFCLLLVTALSISNIINIHIIIFARRIKMSLKNMNDSLQQLIFEESIKNKDEKKQDTTIIRKIRIFSRQYESICNMVRTNNREDGPLLTVMMAFIMMKLNIYIYFIILENLTDNFFFFVKMTMWWQNLLQLVFAVEPFHQTHAEMQRTACLVSELQSRMDENEQASCELLLFLYQLTLDKPMYRPLGMFTIDRSLAVKIFGSMTTYLVIMLSYV